MFKLNGKTRSSPGRDRASARRLPRLSRPRAHGCGWWTGTSRVDTPFVQARMKAYPEPEQFLAQLAAPHALKRMARPDEIAAAALYLAADESSFVTGTDFAVDGGITSAYVTPE